MIVKNKSKSISKSQSKNIVFEEYYNCQLGGKYQPECDNYILRSLNHEMYLQQLKNHHYLYSMINDVI